MRQGLIGYLVVIYEILGFDENYFALHCVVYAVYLF